jgi:Bacterial SCP ortholog
VITALDGGHQPDRDQLRDAVRILLADLAARAPGRSVEVRVPPYGAIQCIHGPRHNRGTPPNVIETDPVTWITLATGRLAWADATAAGRVRASGTRTDISALLPLWEAP